MRCRVCPVRPGPACMGESVPHLCQLVAEGQPGRADQLVAIAEGGVPPSRPPSDLDVRLAMLAETCPNGSGECGCGGKPRTCSRDGRPPEVFRADCLRCVTLDWWQSGVECY